MYKRHIGAVLASEASKMPVVTVVGPRQSGKTTLVRTHFSDHKYISLERPDVRQRAKSDPLGFLATLNDGVILDEIQHASELLSYIQVSVDEDPSPGRFILTGSQNLTLMEGVSQTLAGRTAILRLLPLTLAELEGRPAIDPYRLHESQAPEVASSSELWDIVWSGLYPRHHDRQLDPTRWLTDYVRTYVERDLRVVLRVMDLDAFQRFMRLAAARTAQELNLSDLASDAGVTQPTAKHWLNALQLGFLVTLLPTHHENYRKRLRKRPKLHFLDTGLACYLLGITSAQVLANHPLRGALFESFIVSELVKTFENRGVEPPLYHWRDATGHEIDVLLDLGSGLLPIEIKSGATVPADATKSLSWWRGLRGNHNQHGVLVHGGRESTELHGFRVRPWYLG